MEDDTKYTALYSELLKNSPEMRRALNDVQAATGVNASSLSIIFDSLSNSATLAADSIDTIMTNRLIKAMQIPTIIDDSNSMRAFPMHEEYSPARRYYEYPVNQRRAVQPVVQYKMWQAEPMPEPEPMRGKQCQHVDYEDTDCYYCELNRLTDV